MKKELIKSIGTAMIPATFNGLWNGVNKFFQKEEAKKREERYIENISEKVAKQVLEKLK